MPSIGVEKFKQLFATIPFFKSVLSKINENKIRYALFAGSHVAFLTSNIIPTDIDFIVNDEDIFKLKGLFPFAQTRDYGQGLFLYIGQNEELEFMARANISIENSNYPFRLTPLCWENTELIRGDDFKIRLCNPVDTVIVKAILQRGEEIGKHDIEDLRAVVNKCDIDKKYLKKRLQEINADERVFNVLRKFKLVESSKITDLF